jgi:small subunit ribosomal protein S1
MSQENKDLIPTPAESAVDQPSTNLSSALPPEITTDNPSIINPPPLTPLTLSTEGQSELATSEPSRLKSPPEEEEQSQEEPEESDPRKVMASLLASLPDRFTRLERGQVVKGVLMQKSGEELLVEVGAKSEGIVPGRESQSLSQEELASLSPGDRLLVYVLQPENHEGYPLLSVDKAQVEKRWRELETQFEAGTSLQAQVTGFNKGGLLVKVKGVQGFVPLSQLSEVDSRRAGEAALQAELARLVNTTITLKIIEFNRPRNRLILSQRQAEQEQRQSRRAELLSQLEPGQIREGVVSGLREFGAFVDLGGIDGMVHISELSYSRTSDPGQILKLGERVKIYIMEISEAGKRISLSLKRTRPDPWTEVEQRYQVGQLVEVTITQLTGFGAFARIEDGVEGLIHLSEMSEERLEKASEVVKVGDTVQVRILRIEPEQRRIALSLKRTQSDENNPPQTDENNQPE